MSNFQRFRFPEQEERRERRITFIVISAIFALGFVAIAVFWIAGHRAEVHCQAHGWVFETQGYAGATWYCVDPRGGVMHEIPRR